MSKTKKQCSEMVHNTYGYPISQCSRTRVTWEGSRPWCYQHLPSAVKARAKASQARWEVEKAIEERNWRIKAAEVRVVQAAIEWRPHRQFRLKFGKVYTTLNALLNAVDELIEARKAPGSTEKGTPE